MRQYRPEINAKVKMQDFSEKVLDKSDYIAEDVIMVNVIVKLNLNQIKRAAVLPTVAFTKHFNEASGGSIFGETK